MPADDLQINLSNYAGFFSGGNNNFGFGINGKRISKKEPSENWTPSAFLADMTLKSLDMLKMAPRRQIERCPTIFR